MELNKLYRGDCLDIIKTLPENSIDSIITDPPYELGFMGKSWDNTGIANNKELWAECLRVLKPGGHLLAFSGTRTYHRMACAIEDAGFEVRDMIEWVYGSGFPKSLNIGKAVDKLEGNEREVVAEKETKDFSHHKGSMMGKETTLDNKTQTTTITETKGNSEWEGWGTALKPAHEPICMARKPLAEKTVAENCLKYGTGGINIDESRVESSEDMSNIKAFGSMPENKSDDKGFSRPWMNDKQSILDKQNAAIDKMKSLGRFPANLIHDNSEEVRECFPESTSVRSKRGGVVDSGDTYSLNWKEKETYECGFNDSGNASRFFKSIIYNAKASKSERNKGCEELEDSLGGSLEGGNDKRNGDKPQLKPTKNYHPTVKPIALMEYLIKMMTREWQIVLDPFGWSWTTWVACQNTNRNYILIEKDEWYCDIIEKRLPHPTHFNS